MGSCVADEKSLTCDKVSAPAAPYGRSLLYVATILGRTSTGSLSATKKEDIFMKNNTKKLSFGG